MPFADFSRICMIPAKGSMPEPRPSEFEGFLQSVIVGETRGVSKARAVSLHFPDLCYFTLFTRRCLTARWESGILSAPNLSILRSALFDDRSHNFGAIIAHRLHTNRSKGIIYGGIYATRLARHFNVAFKLSEDRPLPKKYLNYECMVDHDFINRGAPFYQYNLVFSLGTRDIITLHTPSRFDLPRGRYIILPEDQL
jgi:hypothetical protein